jgi:glycosyltransferase involved in cell wall biosynthesis
MKVVIYESSSKGGCYEYAQYLYRACLRKKIDAKIILPVNSILSVIKYEECSVHKILLNDKKKTDSKIISRLRFLCRQFYNPIRFLFYLFKEPASVIIWNDFEQLSAPFWIPVLKLLARKHYHVIILHDPDRDNYPPSTGYSAFCMKVMMQNMNLALYHEYLPEKSYYNHQKANFQSVVHGIYDTHIPAELLLKNLIDWKGNQKLIAVVGNIRDEKNYEIILRALVKMPQEKLLIAGSAANSAVDIHALKKYADSIGIANRIYWEIHFLSDSELAACIKASDIILLYYKPEFVSQSGVLNLLVPHNKQFIYTDTPSGLQRMCRQYQIGVPCVANDSDALARTVEQASPLSEESTIYDKYKKDADWISIIDIIEKRFKENK